MDASLDLSRWRERPRGLAYRRWTIVSNGVGRLMKGRFFKGLIAAAWIVGAILASASFLFSQALTVGGGFDEFLANFGPRGVAVASAIRAMVLLYPDVCVHTLFTCIFWLQSFFGLWFSLFALTALVPSLITRDRSSNALTVYLSRPLTSTDYLVGKLGVIVGVLLLLWTGPLCLTWILGVLFASDRDFLIYSVSPFLHALLFNGICLAALAAIAMGVSAAAKTTRSTILVWLCLWLVAGFVAAVPHMPVWMQRASFSHDLGQIRREVFRLDEALIEAADSLPLTNRQLTNNMAVAGKNAAPTDFGGCLFGLAVLSGLSGLIFTRRLRPE